ncbi:MAG: DUF6460 domain-containing protein [Geminicoccaceae bacterium]
MPRTLIGTALRLLVASFAVGLVLSWLDWSPQDVWLWGRDLVLAAFARADTLLGSALTYVLMGAVVVVPLWLLHLVWRTVRARL